MHKGDDTISTFIGGCLFLATVGIASILLLAWVLS